MKFSLPFLAFLSSVNCSTDVNHRRALTALETQWNVEDPTLVQDVNDANLFVLSFEHGDGDSNVAIEVFDVCPNGDANYNGVTFVGAGPLFYFYDNSIPVDFFVGSSVDGWTQSSPVWKTDWTFSINSAVVTSSAAYTESNGLGTVVFCVRTGQVDDLGQNNKVLVNFKQLEITITYDLTSSVDVTSFSTEVIEEATTNEEDSFETSSALCSGSSGSGTGGAFNQGEEICIEVCSADGFVEVASIDSLTMIITNAPNNANQVVISAGLAVGNTVNAPTCSGGCCTVNFILNAMFFPVGVPDTPASATVTGTGVCSLTITRRRLGKSTGRALQETTTTAFNAKFDIERDEQLASAGTAPKGLMAMAAAGGLALVL